MLVPLLLVELTPVRPFDFLFFFSSRRRHTRYWRDWSSDVCSSDLPLCAARLLVRGNDGAVDPGVLEVRRVGQALEDPLEHPPPRPTAEPLEYTVPAAELPRYVAPGQAGPDAPQHRLPQQPVVLPGHAAVRGLAGQQRRDLVPDRIANHKPIPIHPGPAPPRRDLNHSQAVAGIPNVNGP